MAARALNRTGSRFAKRPLMMHFRQALQSCLLAFRIANMATNISTRSIPDRRRSAMMEAPMKTAVYGRMVFGAAGVFFGVIALLWHDADTWQNLQHFWELAFGAVLGGFFMIAQIAAGIGDRKSVV